MFKDFYQLLFEFNRKLCKKLYRIHDAAHPGLYYEFWKLRAKSYYLDDLREYIQPDYTVSDAKEHMNEIREFNDD